MSTVRSALDGIWQDVQRFHESGGLEITTEDRAADLYHFASLVHQRITDTDIRGAAWNLMNKISSAVLFNESWSGHPWGGNVYWYHEDAHGISAFLPAPSKRECYYNGAWLDFAYGTNWGCQGTNMTGSSISDTTFEWGPMLVEYLNQTNPSAPENLEPPVPVPILTFYQVYLPLVVKGPSGGSCLAESPHPYPDNYDNNWILINPDTNASSTRIHFSRLETESGYDYVYVRDVNNNQINSFSGKYSSGAWSDTVPGRMVKVQLTSDGSMTAWGFCVDPIETVSTGGTATPTPTRTPTATATCTPTATPTATTTLPTLLLLRFEGSFNGEDGEQGVANGPTFVTGHTGLGVLIDDSDTLYYQPEGNINPQQGNIELWLKPLWAGNDNQNHALLDVGNGWYNRICITKDAANNFRFIVWSPDTEYGVSHNVSDWAPQEWHYVRVTWQGDTITLYLDGVLCDTRSSVVMPSALVGRMYIGSSLGESQQAQAVIDDFVVMGTVTPTPTLTRTPTATPTATTTSPTLLVLRFEGSFNGEDGEQGVANGPTFVTGHTGLGVLIDDSDTLYYQPEGNINPQRGIIELWLKPLWAGNDNQNHVFLDVGNGWYNRILITKDAANNFRFIVWSPDTEYGVSHNVSDWAPQEWHYVRVTWQGDTIALYLDGVLCETRSSVVMPSALVGRMYIGSSLGESQQAQAVIDDFVVMRQ